MRIYAQGDTQGVIPLNSVSVWTSEGRRRIEADRFNSLDSFNREGNRIAQHHQLKQVNNRQTLILERKDHADYIIYFFAIK
jgi:hypothetical protein